MDKTDKILTAVATTSFDLFFKFLKSKILAENATHPTNEWKHEPQKPFSYQRGRAEI
jgi:hypothetical protein